jgi:UDP:flavonoid glycosyltransferase YjiC (YdhE family)
MTGDRPVLVVAEGVTLAHVGRAIQLGSWLRHDGRDTVLACDPRYGRFTADLPFPVRPIESLAPDRFMAALGRGRPVFTEQYLERCVEEDLALLRDLHPVAVVGDFRLSLQISARVAGVPYVNVTNAYWSPYAQPRFRMPAIAAVRHVRPVVGDALFRLVRPFAFAVHARPMNRVRKKYGLAPLNRDVRSVYCDGDLTLYADLEQFVPTTDAPRSHRYIGPVAWSAPVVPPAWWDDMMRGDEPIFVTLGSSGAVEALEQVVDALRPLGRPIVVATAGRSSLSSGNNVWVADLVAADAIAAKACTFVCNGGSPMCYQALMHGVPIVGLAGNLDQLLNMHYVERSGAGLLVRTGRASGRRVRKAVERALSDPALAEGARRVAALASRSHGVRTFKLAIAELVGRAAQGPVNPVC